MSLIINRVVYIFRATHSIVTFVTYSYYKRNFVILIN